MSDPGAHPGIDVVEIDRSRPPAIAQSAQAIPETPQIVLGEAAAPACVQFEAQEVCWHAARQNHRLAWVKLEPPADEVVFDPRLPLRQHSGLIVE